MGIQGEFFEVARAEDRRVSNDTEPIAGPVVVEEERRHTEHHTAEHTPLAAKRGMKDLSIPKLYYSISEVSRLTGLEQYVLRYWETEFEELRPQKNRAGNRIYSNKDIKFILKIKELLREKRYTIEGAKQILRDEKVRERDQETTDAQPSSEVIATANEAQEQDPSQLSIGLPNLPLTANLQQKELDELRQAAEKLKTLLTKSR